MHLTKQSPTGRNETFHDNITNVDMTRAQFVRQINNGNYDNYHVRYINSVASFFSNNKLL